MITEHSVDMTVGSECPKCFAYQVVFGNIVCAVLRKADENCGSYKCPFYKPQGCEEWIRIEDGDGINLIPPEEYYYQKYKTGRVR